MARSKKLVSYVHVMGKDGFTSVAFGPDDVVPEWAAKQMGPHCFVTDDEEDTELGPPPHSGKGSGAEAWTEYAATFTDVEVAADATLDEIVELLEAAGKPV